MPSLSESEMMVALAQARLLTCTTYTSTSNGSIYFFDADKHLRLRANPNQPLWIGNTEFAYDGFWQQGSIAKLRKRYENRKPNSKS